jgi:ribosomal protein L22
MPAKYAREGPSEKSAKARGSDLRVHFKNMRETAMAIKKMDLTSAKTYLEEVIAMRRCVVFRRFCGGVGRTAQAKNEGSTNGQGPRRQIRDARAAAPRRARRDRREGFLGFRRRELPSAVSFFSPSSAQP